MILQLSQAAIINRRSLSNNNLIKLINKKNLRKDLGKNKKIKDSRREKRVNQKIGEMLKINMLNHNNNNTNNIINNLINSIINNKFMMITIKLIEEGVTKEEEEAEVVMITIKIKEGDTTTITIEEVLNTNLKDKLENFNKIQMKHLRSN